MRLPTGLRATSLATLALWVALLLPWSDTAYAEEAPPASPAAVDQGIVEAGDRERPSDESEEGEPETIDSEEEVAEATVETSKSAETAETASADDVVRDSGDRVAQLPPRWRVGRLVEGVSADASAEEDGRSRLEQSVDAAFGQVVSAMYTLLFFDVMPDALKGSLVRQHAVALHVVHPDAAVLAGDAAREVSTRQEVDAWIVSAETPAGARWVPYAVSTYEDGLGDRMVQGWMPLLVHESASLESSAWASTSLASDGSRFSIWLDWVFEDAEVLETWSAANEGAIAVLLQDGDAHALFRVESTSRSGVLRAELPAWGDPARSMREHRDIGAMLVSDRGTGPRMPFIVLWLIVGAVFLTLRMGFINLRGFTHALSVVRGKVPNSGDDGEVSHFQALSSALSATVGLGNIAGVAIAVAIGGPGAVFWMLVAAFFGMTSKFVECTLGHLYRDIGPDGRVMGGPMMYLRKGLAERGLGPMGVTLSVIFMVFCIGGSLGGGNMFQANQAYSALNAATPFNISPSLFGIILMVGVGIVILGGIRRIGVAAASIVPLMCSLYVLAALTVLILRADAVPYALYHIVVDAFSGSALYGGAIGVMIVGFQRAAFSNEAGIGSAAIAHSASKTREPARVGMVALLEPFIDTFIVCLATGLVIVVSGVLDNPEALAVTHSGALLTSAAFGSVLSWFPILLSVAIVLFAYSTMLSWSYYGERCWVGLFGEGSSNVYRVIFLIFIYIGSVASLGNVIDFSDLMILSMAFPNILGLYLLVGKVRQITDDYQRRMAEK